MSRLQFLHPFDELEQAPRLLVNTQHDRNCFDWDVKPCPNEPTQQCNVLLECVSIFSTMGPVTKQD